MTSLYALHKDERVWGDPENFRPERFLDDSGKLCLKKDASLPFGAGKCKSWSVIYTEPIINGYVFL